MASIQIKLDEYKRENTLLSGNLKKAKEDLGAEK